MNRPAPALPRQARSCAAARLAPLLLLALAGCPLPQAVPTFADDGDLVTFLRSENLPPILPLAQAKEEFQKRYINEVLERNGGNRTKTAKDLGVDPRTIFRHLEKLEAERRGQPLAPDPEGDA